MASFNSKSDDSAPLSEINITPFVDVMLVLLIIFMVATPLMESGIPIQLPKASAKALPQGEDPIILTLTKDNHIFLGKAEVPSNELEMKIRSVFEKREKQEILIRADSSLPYGSVAAAMASVKNAGINKIGLVTDATEKSKPLK
ncbi:MAG: biopolymer transporter ExbD [Proteobacteria bacterium]|nr:biopolymer transporter ExbD [Pseudomonadota bacterium]NDC26002.1 biopolymer transporter ExbD [Pseudomonadota bacterium]NDD05805.1 biopolymer transporter ExbD [Pseudomonadota bacterium]NDG27893.1 biopolymer transporter ExbD [Pseudomonadota bacterium]